MTPGERAVAAVDREPFIPETIYVSAEDTGWLVPLRRTHDPATWRAHVHADAPVVTAVEYDPRLPAHLRDPAAGRGVVSTSSSSKPAIMARMVDALRLAAGHRVLEIGTGTGWNAAVISNITGPGTVTTVEVTAELADAARRALAATGYEVDVVTGDGERGHPPNAPYDRVIATVAVHTLPYAWVAQTRPGGLLVVPWEPTFHPDGPLAVLRREGDGTAQGRFVGPAHFMPLHQQRSDTAAPHETREQWEATGRPDLTRFGVTVTPEGQQVWLDDPGTPVPSA
ncbi:methyltransferase domain-containing protein [Salinactinospora qingdaonensis]|uniref:Protein-L-isoaspartate O-methyltransferase n=1 Tax=Salinactinospora qingdaonensis TaxID=702744 RepID=A0ABP7FCF7_9ACTN